MIRHQLIWGPRAEARGREELFATWVRYTDEYPIFRHTQMS